MTGRQERKEAARARREAEELARARAASRRQRVRLVGGGFAGLAAVAAIGAALTLGSGEPAKPSAQIPAQEVTDLKTAAEAAGAKITKYDWNFGTGAHTTDPVRYPQNPPTNGPHHPVWAADGNYVGRATPPAERLVHALEHGRIEIQYRPGLPAAQVAQLEALYREDPRHVLLF